MKALLPLALVTALGCSSDKAAPTPAPRPDAQAAGCHFVFSGNTPADADRDSCATLTSAASLVDAGTDDAGAEAGTDAGLDAGTDDAEAGSDSQFLVVDFSSDQIASFRTEISLGDAPHSGSFSSETISDWHVALSTPNGCSFVAGNQVVPAGSFTLALDALPGDGPDAGAPHGTLDMILTLHALSGMDCGPGDNESVTLTF